LRDECLTETVLTSLRHASVVLAAWQREYNEVRPHAALDGQPPAVLSVTPCSPRSSPLRAGFAGGLRPGPTQAGRGCANTCGRDETPRLTEQNNTVTFGLAEIADATFEWRGVGAPVNCQQLRCFGWKLRSMPINIQIDAGIPL
jgi:hypothetical protein